VNGILFFVASEAAGAELWQSDGTPAGTTRVADLVPGPDGSAPAELTAACGRLYFTATTPGIGRELWALDLTPGACTPVDETSCASDPDCGDGDVCTDDACDAATGCASTSIPLCTTTTTTTTSTTTTTLPPGSCSAVPLPDCRRPTEPGASKLRLKDRTPDTRDAARWTWTRGEETSPGDLGDPRATSGYALCLYDGAALRMTLRAPAGGTCRGRPCWKAGREPDVDGKARARVVASGSSVPLPALATLAFPLRVQLQGNGHCWEATFAMPRVHAAGEIRAMSD
jgi:ELWxxDGT repeat protein